MQEVERDGLVIGAGDHRDVTVHRGLGVFISLPTTMGKQEFFCHCYGLVNLLAVSVTIGEITPSNCYMSSTM